MSILESIFGKKEESEEVKLNGVEITYNQLEAKKKEASQQKGMKIIETSPKTFRTKLED
jgi:hypothetical protein